MIKKFLISTYKFNRWWDDLDTTEPGSRFLYFILAFTCIWSIPFIVELFFNLNSDFVTTIPLIVYIPLIIMRISYFNKWLPKK